MTPTQHIDKQIADTPDWRGALMKRLRALILEADSEMVEDWKWDVGVWTHNGMVCALSAFKDHVKMNFFQGALLKDPNHLLNSGLDSKKHRAIDFSEGDNIQNENIKALVREAVSLNERKAS